MDNITPKELPNHRAYASRRALHGSTLIQETLYADDMGATMDSLREIPTSLHQNEDTQHELSIAKSPLRRDPGVWTYRACVSGLTLMWLTGFGVIVYGSLVQRITDTSSDGYEPSMPHHKAFAPFLRLAISAAVTGFSEIAGLIHSTSLRFTLLAEGKLTFNSNLRLFTSCSAYSRVHWWPINIIWLWSLISSYACGSMVLLQTVYAFNGNYSPDIVSGYALIFLGFGLLGQASIATWALRANEFLTWSTNPIFIASLCREQGYLHVSHRRTMLSVHDAQIIGIYEIPQLPKARQRSLLNAHAQVRQVLIASWIVTLFGFLFFAAISLVYQFVDSPGPTWGSFSRSYTNDWSLIPNWADTTAFLAIGTTLGQQRFNFGPWFVCKYIFTCVLLGAVTLNLHIVELIVQCLRDESLWRKTASPSGLAPGRHGALFTAMTSWHTIGLFVFKTLLHWMFSLAFGLYWEGVKLFIPQFLFTALLMFTLAAMATSLALYQPQGPQPATFGNLQTLVDLVDMWPRGIPQAKNAVTYGDGAENDTTPPPSVEGVVMYWGDKGEGEDGLRRAGTSTAPLKAIVMAAEYI